MSRKKVAMLNWEQIEREATSNNEQADVHNLGVQLKELYFELITNGDAQAHLSPLNSCVVEAVEEVAKHSSKVLNDAYSNLTPPMMDDTARVAASFIRKVSTRFRDALCSELYENPDLSSNARGVIIVLAPTLITLLGLPLPYAAVAVPLSVIISRIGIKSFCQDYEIEKSSKDFINQRLEIHRKNLLLLEQECARYSSTSLPDLSSASVSHEEAKIQQLEEQLRSLNSK
jgi:hypothetical protein